MKFSLSSNPTNKKNFVFTEGLYSAPVWSLWPCIEFYSCPHYDHIFPGMSCLFSSYLYLHTIFELFSSQKLLVFFSNFIKIEKCQNALKRSFRWQPQWDPPAPVWKMKSGTAGLMSCPEQQQNISKRAAREMCQQKIGKITQTRFHTINLYLSFFCILQFQTWTCIVLILKHTQNHATDQTNHFLKSNDSLDSKWFFIVFTFFS